MPLFSSSKKLYKNISAKDAKLLLDQDKTIKLIDVRTTEEYVQTHIKDSISLPLDKLKHGIDKIASKDTQIIVYCQSGMRATTACQQLATLGYKNVSNMGGIISWKYETAKGS